MADGEKTRKRLRFPRRLVVAMGGGLLLLLTASAGAAYFMGSADDLLGVGRAVYGAKCRLVDSVSFRQGDERWVRKYVAVGDVSPLDRLRTALRVAESTAAGDQDDLVLVVVIAKNGPSNRALIRDEAVGAKVVYAPHPARVADVDARFSAAYVDADATPAGYFYGKTIKPSLAELDEMAAAMKKPFGCAAAASAKEATAGAATTRKPARARPQS